ncbi:putative metal-dependent membrane protease [Saccharomonospora marina XMU15]|uniref:Putative metal-dependent membrane protease n=2 Tax=Saccharomonospora TaxID=1851 RepID=H5WZ86_9PSEU|nr:putative metal-dependent membrane protease [Saccharomonospora marina XMU15]
MLNKTGGRAHVEALIVLATGLAIFVGSALWLLWTGNTGVRYSADHDGTVPMWWRWIPALAGIALVRLVPPDVSMGVRKGRKLRIEAAVLLAAAVLFATTLRLAGGGEPAHTLLKLPLLLGVPAVMFWLLRREPATWTAESPTTSWRRYGPAIPVAVWLALSYAGPLSPPPSDYALEVDAFTLAITIVVVLLVNSVLEEVFYRRWLQTRWELLLGRWPAIVLASLLWAAWHIGIQGTGSLQTDLASTFVNQGVLGLFLGYLWSKYRTMWPILVVHGAVNVVPVLTPLL